MRRVRCSYGLAAVLVMSGCGVSSPPGVEPIPPGTLMADFALPDVNPASTTSGAAVSPRDFLGSASAWYFGHAT